MTVIIAIVNQKGGVGKTTTAVTLAHGLAIEGQRVLIVDMDSQGQVAVSLGLAQKSGLYRLLAKDANHAITDTGRPNLWAVLGNKKTAVAAARVNEMHFREAVLTHALKSIKPQYDIIILDTAPGADVLQINAFCACSHFLIPTRLDHLSAQGAGATLDTAASLQKLGALNARFLGVLPTMWEQRTKHTKELLKDQAAQFGNLLWAPIPDDTKAREASAEGQTLWEYAPICRALSGASTSNGLVGGYARALERLMEELEL